MCGIAGHIGPNPPDPGRVAACMAALGRRGPDASGTYAHTFAPDRTVTLLHTRLRIIDLGDRADQPFRHGPDALAFNGELYNYVELRRALAREGVAFATASDTEVLLHWLARRGPAGLDACEGMWAFAHHNETSGRLTLCRDRFGEKPLWLHENEDGLWFASEVKALAALSGKRFSVNTNHLRRHLVNGYKALYKTRETFFEGVRELPPATALVLDPDAPPREERYWTPALAQDPSLSRGDCVAMAREALVDAVRLRLRADVPLAFCMSGGVDSNALISVAARELGHDVHGFTIVNTDARYEEQDLVEHAVRELGIRHTGIPVTTDHFLDRLRELVRYHDAPVCTITYYAHWLLMREVAAAGCKISVSGTAADELFSGYYDHFLAYLHDVRNDPDLHARSLAAWREHVQPHVRNPFLRDPELFTRDPSFRGHLFMNADGFSEYLVEPWAEPFTETAYTGDLLRNRMLNELFHEAVPVILHEDDLNAMHWSVENRSPFLDRRLFETCARIPTRHLMRDGYAKSILRDAMRGIVPDRILDSHRKVGFNAPIRGFLDTGDPGVRAALLDDSPVFGLLRRDRIEAMLDREALPNSESKFLFYFLSAKMFLEEFA
jgi:asparagine synthase (glutamine-hydrolysing)